MSNFFLDIFEKFFYKMFFFVGRVVVCKVMDLKMCLGSFFFIYVFVKFLSREEVFDVLLKFNGYIFNDSILVVRFVYIFERIKKF